MHSRDGALLSALFLVVAGCTEPSTAPRSERRIANAAVRTGEKLRRVVIAAHERELAVGSSLRLESRMYFSRGGELPGAPYVRWSSSDPCVAAVVAGELRGLRGGTVEVVARFAGKADTARIIVPGDSTADAECEAGRAESSRDDSDGTPSTRFGARPGERLRAVVLYSMHAPVPAGDSARLASELWFSQGGRLQGPPHVAYRSLSAAVATVDERTGWVRGHSAGRTWIVAAFASHTDTVAVHVEPTVP